jgi:hypothetical protein
VDDPACLKSKRSNLVVFVDSVVLVDSKNRKIEKSENSLLGSSLSCIIKPGLRQGFTRKAGFTRKEKDYD